MAIKSWLTLLVLGITLAAAAVSADPADDSLAKTGQLFTVTSKFHASYTLPADPMLNPQGQDDERFKTYLELPRDKQELFLERRAAYISRLAKFLTRKIVGAILIKTSKPAKSLIDDDEESLVSRWEDSKILSVNRTYDTPSLPPKYVRSIQGLLKSIDDLLWNDCGTIANGDETAFLLVTEGKGDAILYKWGIYFGAGLVNEVVINEKTKTLKIRSHGRFSSANREPIEGLNFDLNGGIVMGLGSYHPSLAKVGETAINPRITKGRTWKLPFSPVEIIYGSEDPKVATRTGIVLSPYVMNFSMLFTALATGGSLGAMFGFIPPIHAALDAFLLFTSHYITSGAASIMMFPMSIIEAFATVQTKYVDFRFSEMTLSFGEGSFLKKYAVDPATKTWELTKNITTMVAKRFAKAPNPNADNGNPICLNLMGFSD